MFYKTEHINVSRAFFKVTSNSLDEFSVPLVKAIQIFSYFTFSSPLHLAFLLPYYSIQDSRFYLDYLEVHKY